MEVGVVFLGTSAAMPTRYRGLPGLVLKYRGSLLLFDCGEGTQHRLVEAGLSPLKIKAVFITHLHGDHVFGLPGLIQSMAMNNRRESLYVYGPKGIAHLLEAVFEAARFAPPFNVYVVEVRGGERFRVLDRVWVSVFPVRHTVEAYGYAVYEEPRPGKVDVEKARRLGIEPGPLLGLLQRGIPVSVGGRLVRPEEVVGKPRPGFRLVYTGDTAPIDGLRKVVGLDKVDVLVHDATFTSEYELEAHEEGHSTALDAAKAAIELGARVLVLTHFSARYRSPEPLVFEASRLHPNVVAAEDLLKLPIRL